MRRERAALLARSWRASRRWRRRAAWAQTPMQAIQQQQQQSADPPGAAGAPAAAVRAAAADAADHELQRAAHRRAAGLEPRAGCAAHLRAAQPRRAGARLSRPGEVTQSEGGPVASRAARRRSARRPGATAVFGASLFTREATARHRRAEPELRHRRPATASRSASGARWRPRRSAMVDPSGNLFLPNVGPVRVAGMRAGDLQRVVEAEVQKVYTQQVQVYAVLLSTQRIGVFVTGFVRTPGRYRGLGRGQRARLPGARRRRGSGPRLLPRHRGAARRAHGGDDRPVPLPAGRRPAAGALAGGRHPRGRPPARDGRRRRRGAQQLPVRGAGPRHDRARARSSYARAAAGGDQRDRSAARAAASPSRATPRCASWRGCSCGDQDTVTFITDSPARTVRVTVEGSRHRPLRAGHRPRREPLQRAGPCRGRSGAGRHRLACSCCGPRSRSSSAAPSTRRWTGWSASSSWRRARPPASRRSAPSEAQARLLLHPARAADAAGRPAGGVERGRAVRAGAAGGRRRHRHPRALLDRAGLGRGDGAARGGVAGRGCGWPTTSAPPAASRRADGSALMIRRASGELVLDPANQSLRPGDELIALP